MQIKQYFIILNSDSKSIPVTNKPLTMTDLLNLYSAKLTDGNHIYSDAVITVDTSDIKSDVIGSYNLTFMTVYNEQDITKKAILHIVPATGQATVVPNTELNSDKESELPEQSAKSVTNNNNSDDKSDINNQKKPMKKWQKYLIGVVILLLAIIIGVTACNHHQEQSVRDAQQSSQISDLKNRNDKNNNKINKLQQQMAALKAAQKQYQKDKNEAELNQRLNDIKEANATMKEQYPNDTRLNHAIDKLSTAADKVRSNPQQDLSDLNQKMNNLLQNQQEQQNILNSIQEQLQAFGKWLNSNI